jgi:transposase
VIGVDVAKSVFQIHGADASGRAILRQQLRRAQVVPFFAQMSPSLIGMEACGSAHHWARTLREMGHTVRLMAPQFVKPYVKTNKSDRADAEAIAEAVTRPGMRFVGVKEIWQQDLLAEHRVRDRQVKARTALTNEIRGLLQEYGIVFPQGTAGLREGLLKVLGSADSRLSEGMNRLLQRLLEEWTFLERALNESEKTIVRESRSREVCRSLEKLPGIGPITSTALVATVGDPKVFKNGRHLSAFLGLVPRHEGTGGKTRLGGISKRGDRYVRKMLVHGARSALRAAAAKKHEHPPWAVRLADRRGFNKACVALANKNARRCWAIMAGREVSAAATSQDAASAVRAEGAFPTAPPLGRLRSQRGSTVENARSKCLSS